MAITNVTVMLIIPVSVVNTFSHVSGPAFESELTKKRLLNYFRSKKGLRHSGGTDPVIFQYA